MEVARRTALSRRWRTLKLDVRRQLAAWFVRDRRYLSRLYRDRFGVLPNLDDPRGFNEKIMHRILVDRREFLTCLADKLRVRDYVRERAPGLALPRLHWWSSRAADLRFDALPDAFVLKANHGSGFVHVVGSKRATRRADLVRIASQWLATDFTLVGREWAYRGIRRAVYAEELLTGDTGGPPFDFKLFVFAGRVRMIQVDRDRFARHTQVLYDERWSAIDGSVAAAQGPPLARPATLSEMIAAAEALAAGIDFLRVDLYEIGGRPVFGELTHYPNKGLSRFRPASLDALLGNWLTLDPQGHVALAYRPSDFSGT